MIDERLRELINRQVDGENSAEESHRLEQALWEDPEARQLFDDLVELRGRFEEAGGIDPPPALRRKILASTTRAAEAATSPVRAEPRAGRRSLIDSLREAFTPRLAYAFAAGIGVGAAIFVLATEPGPGGARVPPNAARGTMAPRRVANAGAAERVEFGLPAGNGSGSVMRSPGEIRVEMSFASQDDAVVVLSLGDTTEPPQVGVKVYSNGKLEETGRLVPAR